MTTTDAKFDYSDADLPPIDHVDDILEVAGSVLEDYGPRPGGTRIERMARWITFNVGVLIPAVDRVGAISHYTLERHHVWRVGDVVGVAPATDARNPFPLTTDEARTMSAALLRAANDAERED